MRNIPEPIFTPVAENIKANREDERKSFCLSSTSISRQSINR